MSDRRMIGVFAEEHDLLRAVKAFRARGHSIEDVFTPYFVHGLDKAMGLGRSRLPWVTFLLGLVGAGLKVYFEYWTTMIDWPINVGGKPWDSLPAFVPVTFEVMVLVAGVSTVLVFFALAKLIPGRKSKLVHPRVTDDRFVLVLDETDAAFDPEQVRRMLISFNAENVSEQIGEAA
ncbi:MAG: hypothetical protein MAG453_00486 [Calditrichaeota bacterium]|nr:hypothetical protein [Calditrichota bacterium]